VTNTKTYSSLVIVSSGGQWFEDTSLKGLLRQTADFIDDYNDRPPFGDYSERDHLQNLNTVGSIMTDNPSFVDEAGNRHYFPTIH
jgi:hypothetical protein